MHAVRNAIGGAGPGSTSGPGIFDSGILCVSVSAMVNLSGVAGLTLAALPLTSATLLYGYVSRTS